MYQTVFDYTHSKLNEKKKLMAKKGTWLNTSHWQIVANYF